MVDFNINTNIDFSDKMRRLAQLRLRHDRRTRYRLYRKLQGMLNVNEALSRCLERLWDNASEMGRYPDRPAALALKEWSNKDRAGEALSEAMVDWVPMSEIFMIRAGEESGAVAQSLQAILDMGKAGKELRQAVAHAIAYPLFITVLVMGVLWMFGVNLIQPMREIAPKLAAEKMGALGFVSDIIRSYSILIGIVFAGIVSTIWVSMPYWCGNLRIRFDKIPPWSWYRMLIGGTFMLSLSALLKAQVPLKRALEVLEEQASPWLRERLFHARQEILRGKNLGEALRSSNFEFPSREVALDLEILSERADVGEVIEHVTEEWLTDNIEDLQKQAAVVRTLGLMAVGGVIAWAMLTVFGMVGNAGDMIK
jgi:type II secretory pathway component PulF